MRQMHDKALTPEQAARIQSGERLEISKSERRARAIDDHSLRVRCVEMAIKSIDAWPQISMTQTLPQATSVTNNFMHPDVRSIAEQIYVFVNEPLARLDE